MIKFSYFYIVLYQLSYGIGFSNRQLVGDRCIFDHNRNQGVCKLDIECLSAFQEYRQNGIRPTICGYEGYNAVICCSNQLSSQFANAPPAEKISVTKCKEYNPCSSKQYFGVVGGYDARLGEFPHMAALGWPLITGDGYDWKCGASLVSENYIISAAHCTYIPKDGVIASERPTIVRLGELNLKSDDDGATPQDIGISSFIVHPQYRPPAKYHDIALIRLETSARFDTNIKPVCLWQEPEFPSTSSATAIGWGKIGHLEETSDVLQYVYLKMIDKPTCAAIYSTSTRILPNGIDNGQLCAGELSGGKDTCQAMIKFSYFHIVLFQLSYGVLFSNGLFAGDQCVIGHNRNQGVCKMDKECPSVFQEYIQNGIRPTICGFEGSNSIVCCSNQLNSQITNASSTERISITKCKEYNPCSSKPNIDVVVGGFDAHLGEFPHMAALGWPLISGNGYDWKCGASLVSEDYVVSAAHCTYAQRANKITSETPTVVRLGDLNLKSDDDGATPQDIGISNIIIHPQYKPPAKYHDIALIRLEKSARFDENVKPICLWHEPELSPFSFISITGWGKTGYHAKASDVLQFAYINIIDKPTCAGIYSQRTRILPSGIDNGQLCAGVLDGGKDTCQGDSGGPLSIKHNGDGCGLYLIGITSFGIGCGGRNTSGIYTRTSSYIDWIESVIWP